MAKSKEKPTLTVDALIENEQGKILLIRRGVKPFKGDWCLPGGKVDAGERVEAALEREVIEEVGVRIGIRELVGVYSDPDRDPRGHFVSVVYHATIIGGEPETTDEAEEFYWASRNDDDISLGFDHGQILKDWWSKKGEVSSLSKGKAGRSDKPQMRKHPVEPMVEQIEDERVEGVRLVEDEAGRGKRAVKSGGAANAQANRMRGSGTKKTAAAGMATAKSNTRRK